ncbi:hypothetical protein H5410_002736, partial [Solanum commersonii]
MNAHNKTQFNYARISCVLKDSSCDTPSPKILILAILATRIRYNTHTHKEEHNACFHLLDCPYFTIDLQFGLLKNTKVFLRLVVGVSTK